MSVFLNDFNGLLWFNYNIIILVIYDIYIIEIRNNIEYPYYIPKNKSTGVIIINNYLINEYKRRA